MFLDLYCTADASIATDVKYVEQHVKVKQNIHLKYFWKYGAVEQFNKEKNYIVDMFQQRFYTIAKKLSVIYLLCLRTITFSFENNAT